MSKIFNRAITILGERRKVGTYVVTVLGYNEGGNVTEACGASVPVNADTGFASGCKFYLTSGGSVGATVYFNEGTAASADFNAVASTAAGGVSTWDQLYSNDTTMVVDGASVTFSGTHATNDTFTVTATGGTGDAIQITNTGTGKDINGSSSTWNITKAGVAVLTGVTMADAKYITMGDSSDATIGWNGTLLNIAGATDFDDAVTMQNGLTVAVGDAAISDGSLTMTDGDNAVSFSLTNNTITSANMVELTSTSTTTGAVVLATANGLTDGTIFSAVTTASGMGTGAFFRANDGSDRFKVAADGATTIATGVNSTVALTITGIQTSGEMVVLTSSGVTGSGKGVLDINSSGNSASGSAQIRIAPSGTPVDGSIALQFVGSGKLMQAASIDCDSVDNSCVLINGGGALASGKSVLHVTADGTPASGAIFTTFDFSSATMTNNPVGVKILTAASTGASLSIVSTATAGTGILQTNNALLTGYGYSHAHTTSAIANGGSLMNLSSSGADTATTSGTLLNLASTGAANASTNVLLTTKVATGIGVSIVADTLTTGQGLSGTFTSASTHSSNSVQPVVFSTTMTGAGGVGGRVKAYMTTNVALGGWSNALKGEVLYGAAGGTTGLGSAICAEMTLSAGTTPGTYAPLELELNLGASAVTGAASSLIYANVNETGGNTAFRTSGYVLNLAGLTAGAANVFRTGLTGATVVGNMTAALRIKVGATDYFIPLATATT